MKEKDKVELSLSLFSCHKFYCKSFLNCLFKNKIYSLLYSKLKLIILIGNPIGMTILHKAPKNHTLSHARGPCFRSTVIIYKHKDLQNNLQVPNLKKSDIIVSEYLLQKDLIFTSKTFNSISTDRPQLN